MIFTKNRKPHPLHLLPYRGLTYNDALEKYEAQKKHLLESGDGSSYEANFYMRNEELHGEKHLALVLWMPKVSKHPDYKLKIFKPNVPPNFVPIGSFLANYTKIDDSEMKAFAKKWKFWHKETAHSCSHFGKCNNPSCTSGMRIQERHVLTGSVFEVWPEVQALCPLNSEETHGKVNVLVSGSD